ncbi:SusC/RagA family TonB-linked outer membrane protein [Ferruginibacter yonginensis]|uniref:SusC/RagA family TonB-linked outer membrane protein n=1 Tax=Ferruginibacter yonginensis TaxID=1310416 RepID=A0ABV8QT81_9BACT
MNVGKLTKLLLTVCFGLFSFVAFAQTKTVTGTVTDDKGATVSGVSVTVKGSKNGVSTNADGTFKINVPTNATTLSFSSVGYDKKDVAIGSGNEVNVVLTASNNQLTEVVVVGYGSVKKKDLTGAVAVVSAKSFNQGPITGPDQLIQGKVAGLQVIANSGQPGAATTVRIRGNASVRSGAGQPLYVVDGVPLDGRNARPQLNALGLGSTADVDPLLFLNPNDIASVQVLKDASASAIYGSRGANGVILIETKKGNGAVKVDFNFQVGTSSVAKKYDVLDAGAYRSALSKYGISNGDQGGNVDAQDAILRSATSKNANIAVSGGNDKSNYRLSLGYFGQEGIVIGSDLTKYMTNFTGQSKLVNDKLILDYGFKIGQVNEKIAPVSENAGFEGSLVGNALQWNPTRNFYKPDGSFDQPAGALNPLALAAAYNDRSNLLNASGYVAATYKLSKELDVKIFASQMKQAGERKAYMQSFLNQTDVLGRGWGFVANNELVSQVLNGTLNYKKELTKKLRLDALVGYEYFKSDRSGSSIFGKDFSGIPLNSSNILQYASQSSLAVSSFVDPNWELQSYFGRTGFVYNDKYFLTATVRADGSTKFGKNNRYGYFPSFAAKWAVSNEAFMSSVKWVDNLALRVGYGVTGSQEFPSGAAQDQYTVSQQSIVLSNVANPDLKWEKEKQINVGVDFTLFNKKINGNVDYFKKDRTNILFNTQVTLPGPATKYWVNVPCSIVNQGVEISLNSDIINNKNVVWNVAINATFLKNELQNYSFGNVLTGTISGQGLSGVSVQKLVNNKPINAFYTKDFAGFDASGNSIFNGGDNNRVYAGNPNPTSLLGFRSEVNYKKWTFTVNGYGLFGQKIYNNTANATVGLGNLGKGNVDARFIGTGEAVGNTPSASNRYIEDGSFFRLANATVNYNFGNIGATFKNVNVFVTGSNLFVITKYSGFDPEVNTNKAINGVASQGIEYTPYPSARNFTAGFRVSF